MGERQLPDLAPPPPRGEVPALAGALRGAEGVLRLVLGIAWLGLAVGSATPAVPPALSGVLRPALALTAALVLVGLRPRLATAVGLLLTPALLPEGIPPGSAAALLGAGIARLALQYGSAGRWLARGRELSRARAVHLAAMELARARATHAAAEADRAQALRQAGDAYERAGRAREARRRIGLSEDPAAAALRLGIRALAMALRRSGRLHAALEDPVARASRRRDPGVGSEGPGAER